uniref:Mos1 transposase HTH domain-containing protein n=1 Tax=Triatoma infestans TaxID=30076 RepID=A0A170XR25_TRIIF
MYSVNNGESARALHVGRTRLIRFLVAEGMKDSEIHERMFKVYGNNCLNVYKWVELFKSGRVSVCDEQRKWTTG